MSAQEREVALRDMLLDKALAAAGRDPGRREQLDELPARVRDRAVAADVVGYLIGIGAVAVPDPAELAWKPLDIPEHLRADLEQAAAASRRVPELLAALAR
ncbi:hypothetical protein [Micromonospora chalcea]|uniref:hypothetical protein n=1 Tax=Micromonospora chalcea TaxID=1874 RepID=UPI003D71F4D5